MKRKQIEYFSSWRTDTFTCPACGWSGEGSELDTEMFDSLFELRCPVVKCDHRINMISYPVHPEVEAAAADGNEEAIEMLRKKKEREAQVDPAEEGES